MSNNFETLGLFPVPIIKIKFKDHYKYNFPEVEKKDKKPNGWVDSVHTTFPGIPDDDLLVPPLVRDSLKRDLKFSIIEVFQQLNIPTNIEFNNLWYNIYHDDQGQEKHAHLLPLGIPQFFWSGIYYNKNASPTTFFNTNRMIETQHFLGYQETSLNSCLTKDNSPHVEDGDILLFPPYLEHSVICKDEYKNKMRMTFSFNINLCFSEGISHHSVYDKKMY